MNGILRAGLVGLGRMGRHHARVLRSMPDVELVAAVDTHDQIAVTTDVEVVYSVAALLELGIDLCVVATPTVTHEKIALELAEAGVPTLIEKPLAHESSAAQAIVESFRRNRVPAAVGHIERFNPALRELRARLAMGELGEVYQVVTRRQGPFPARIVDAGVIFDLATHDIDLTAWVTGAAYRSVSARTAHRSGRPNEDLVSAVAELSGGIVATHLVNWLTPFKERVTVVTGERGCLVADTLTADITFYENGSEQAQWDRVAAFRGVAEGNMIRYAIAKPEPLMTEVSNFVAAVRGDRTAEVVTLEEAVATVRIAEALRESAVSGENIRMSS